MLPNSYKEFFSAADKKQIAAQGLSFEEVIWQVERIRQGARPLWLIRPCRVDDGVLRLTRKEQAELVSLYDEAMAQGRSLKFVPASGAASRMFQSLWQYFISEKESGKEAQNAEALLSKLKAFAFFEDLNKAVAAQGLKLSVLMQQRRFRDILRYLLTTDGLDYANLPKCLIKFHRYVDGSRTPLEEHLWEAAGYVRDEKNIARVHFTVSAQHEGMIKAYVRQVLPFYAAAGVEWRIDFSVQEKSTDTIALNCQGLPLRDKDGRLVFRPGGHGALLKNLEELRADVVFIKNIDNVVVERVREDLCWHKRVIGGLLVKLQRKIFDCLEILGEGEMSDAVLNGIEDFARDQLFLEFPEDFLQYPRERKIDRLFSRLNRPLRVCGVVPNTGEPGGAPFWVHGFEGNPTIQIVEAAQVDQSSEAQGKIFSGSAYFNPVDIVCGVRDFCGRPFPLKKFVAQETGFVSLKPYDGQDILAYEQPGLWNGSMAGWLTVLVEVPAVTFVPVKTVEDLLSEKHQV